MPKKHFVIRGRKMQKKKTNVLSFEEGFSLIKKLNSNAEIEKVECRRMLVKFVEKEFLMSCKSFDDIYNELEKMGGKNFVTKSIKVGYQILHISSTHIFTVKFVGNEGMEWLRKRYNELKPQ